MDAENPQAPAETGSKPARKARARAATKRRKAPAKRAPKKRTAAKKANRSRIGAGMAVAGRLGRQTRDAVTNTTIAASKKIGRALRDEREKGFPKAKAVIVVGGIILDVALIAREMMRPAKSNAKLAQKALDVIGKRFR